MVPAAVLASGLAYVESWPSPLEAPAEQLMQWTPLPVAEYLLQHLGSLARPAALLGALALCMLIGGVAGAGYTTLSGGKVRSVLAVVPAAVLLWLALFYLFPPSRPEPAVWLALVFMFLLIASTRSRSTVHGRREFLLRGGTVVGGAGLLITLFSIEPVVRALATRRLFAYRPPSGLGVKGISDLVTPTDRFYVMDKVLQDPVIGPPGWGLQVDGEVRSPLSIDYGGLLRLKAVHRYVTMECVDNPVGGSLMSNCLWTGVMVADILRQVGPRGDTVVFHGVDDYAESTPLADLESSGAFVAYAMNGETLPRSHGYPARLVIPGVYGFKSVKWLNRIEVVRGPYHGNWRAHGWTETARIHTTARIDVARRSPDGILLAGVAFAGVRGVRAVEARVNAGPWRRASLGPTLGDQSWVQWAVRFRGLQSAHVEVRAIDRDGRPQEYRVHGAYPDGSTGWPSVTV